ncbi:anti-repressor SinI family protein [Caldibacillus lycopersici]|uniref:Anti-repressor SinI family protein n=1 Tax=Perspicuibacillus lycopersici TaxID=1325689 RepID=A0AAE3IVS1_9BACI|nr:anti-repressor SinI family protein [Perspicuibacillus lycopersici]MCU9614508.1 anti-repressor SinI family protein [Perspicuibacillus lycopersici]
MQNADIKTNCEVDMEWMLLIKEAFEMGITVEEIRAFLKTPKLD